MYDYFDTLFIDNLDLYKNHLKNNERVINSIIAPQNNINLKEKIKLNIGEKIVKDIKVDEIINENINEENLQELNPLYYSLSEKIKNKIKEKDKIKQELNNLNLDTINQDNLKIVNNKTFIIKVYEYLFDSFFKFNLVYNDLFEFINSYKIDIYKQTVHNIDEISFLKKFRTDNLSIKLSILAFELGEYNYNLFKNNISKDKMNLIKKEEFAEQISKIYNGTQLDFMLLKEFSKIVEADLSGNIIFEENKEEDEEKSKDENKEKSIINNKTKKSIFNLKPFKLKK